MPPRYVLERDVGDFRYRRYQHVLDVEVPIEGNASQGHTASYVRRDPNDQTAVATAFVTVYAHAQSLSAEVGDSLRSLNSYEMSVQDVGGGYAWALQGASGDKWLLWVSRERVVKIGAPPGEEAPEDLVEAYMDLYPSDLDEHGRAREGTASAGTSHRASEEASGDELPASLREGAPR